MNGVDNSISLHDLREREMAHIDTLAMYREYLAAGYTEDQSVAAVNVLSLSIDGIATKEDLRELEKDLKGEMHTQINNLERDLKYFFIKTIGSSVIATVLMPIIVACLLKYFRVI